jgi:hypothetical protein
MRLAIALLLAAQAFLAPNLPVTRTGNARLDL